MSYSRPDLTINGVKIDRIYCDIGTVSHYYMRYPLPDGMTQNKLVASPMVGATSRTEPIQQKPPDDEEIEWLTRVINGEDMD